MQTNFISVEDVQAKVAAGAKILDVREYSEWVAAHVHGAQLIPLGKIKADPQIGAISDNILILCRSGRRATEAARILNENGIAKTAVIEGGIEAWKAAGLPTQKTKGPIALDRQVRMGAGALILLGLAVPQLRFLAWFVPCGLVFSGITGFCGMGLLLAKAPWNKPKQGAAGFYCSTRRKV